MDSSKGPSYVAPPAALPTPWSIRKEVLDNIGLGGPIKPQDTVWGPWRSWKNGNGSEDWKNVGISIQWYQHIAMSPNCNEWHASVDTKTHVLKKPTIYHSQSQIGRVLPKFYQRLPFVPQHLRSTSVGILVSGPADGMGEGAAERPIYMYIYIYVFFYIYINI